jgi:hypothetical protein
MKHVPTGVVVTVMCVSVPLGTYGLLTTVAGAASPPHTLPVGAATSYLFGYTKYEGSKISLLPPNDGDVNQSLVARGPKLGPFHIKLSTSFAGWPSACNLTGLLQLKALEPSVTALDGAPVGSKAEILGSGANTPQGTSCKFDLKTKFDPQGYSRTPSWVEISLQGIGSGASTSYQQSRAEQKAMAPKYPAQYADYPALKNGVKCFDDGNELQCLKGDVRFWVSGQKVTGGNLSGVDQSVWIDQVEIPLAEVIGAELTTSD